MWLILTIIFALATLGAVLYLDSLIPALIFLGLSLVFLGFNWNKRGNRRS